MHIGQFALATAALVLGLFTSAGTSAAEAGQGRHEMSRAAAQDRHHRAKPPSGPARHRIDHSGKRQTGKASIYARKFVGRKMANGKRMQAADDNAASKTLPLGTTARVTNLETGQSARVTIEDRGPYVPGRIVDLSPGTARQIGLTHEQGVAPVEVAPIEVPQPDGAIKPGDGAKRSRR